MQYKSLFFGVFASLSLVLLSGCTTTTDATVAQKRQAVQTMKDKVLTELFTLNANVNLILASFGGGYGVVTDNQTGQQTYMKMAEVGVGLGAGIKDFSAVFVFHNEAVMSRFVEKGWAFGAQADAAAKAGDKGAAKSGEVTADNITIYQLTESGLALQATVKGTKYWKDDQLN